MENNKVRIIKINENRLRDKLFKVYKKGLATGTAIGLTIGIAATALVASQIPHKVPIIPEGYYQAYTTEQVERNDTLSEIASEYYDPDIYGSYFDNFNDYVETIASVNQINKNNITPYTNIIIPVFIEEDNIYRQQIAAKEQQIRELDRWVEYTPHAGDTILGLAYLGAGDSNEAYSIKNEIMNKNGLTNSIIRNDRTYLIVNPEIGKLKKEIFGLKEKLRDSLKVHQEENSKTK